MKLIPCQNRYSGFTLIELLVVMAILAMLAGLVGPKVMNALGESKSKTARVQLEELSAALDIYRLDTGNYPRSHHGLRALVERVDGVENWNGPYLKKRKLPKDPWGAHYNTVSLVNTVTMISIPSAPMVQKGVMAKRRISRAGSDAQGDAP